MRLVFWAFSLLILLVMNAIPIIAFQINLELKLGIESGVGNSRELANA